MSATLKNQYIFERMCEDLRKPGKALKGAACKLSEYKLYSLVTPGEISNLNLSDFVVPMEKFGIPQTRHRVIILGIRDNINILPKMLEEQSRVVNARKVLDGLPEVRSGVSREEDSNDAWRNYLYEMAECSWFASPRTKGNEKIPERLDTALKEIRHSVDRGRGGEFMSRDDININYKRKWFLDPRIEGVCNHTTRGHIVEGSLSLFLCCLLCRG